MGEQILGHPVQLFLPHPPQYGPDPLWLPCSLHTWINDKFWKWKLEKAKCRQSGSNGMALAVAFVNSQQENGGGKCRKFSSGSLRVSIKAPAYGTVNAKVSSSLYTGVGQKSCPV